MLPVVVVVDSFVFPDLGVSALAPIKLFKIQKGTGGRELYIVVTFVANCRDIFFSRPLPAVPLWFSPSFSSQLRRLSSWLLIAEHLLPIRVVDKGARC